METITQINALTLMRKEPRLGYYGKTVPECEDSFSWLVLICEECCKRNNPYLMNDCNKEFPKCSLWDKCIDEFDKRAKGKYY